MEKIQVNDALKEQYIGLVRGAQQMEQSIGAAEYRLYKMKKQREQVDVDLKTWWDSVAEEYKLDKAQDYYVDNDGNINQVERPEQPAPVAPVDPDAKPDVAEAVVQPEAPVEPPVEAPDNKEGGTAADLT